MSTSDYPGTPAEHPEPLALEATATEPARPVEPLDTVEGLTITEAATMYGLSVSTIRRLLKAGKVAGAAKVTLTKGAEYRIPRAGLEALGYREKVVVARSETIEARTYAQLQELSARVRDLEATLELERVRREAAEGKAETLAANLEDLRSALSKLPPALEGSRRRRWRNR